jgi:protocatechuate 3,4-dioxygenase beta subunit
LLLVLSTVGSIDPAVAGDPAPRGEEAAETAYLAALELARAGGEGGRVLDAIQTALAAGASPARTLTETAFGPLHGLPSFRELIRGHARQSEALLTLPGEPGRRLRVSGVVRDEQGQPIAGALVYVYHTDARGLYSQDGKDEQNPRIFGYLRTAADGTYGFRTVRPASYPDSDVKQHVHYQVEAEGFAKRVVQLEFADDPLWKGSAVPAWARPVTTAADGEAVCSFDVTLERR